MNKLQPRKRLDFILILIALLSAFLNMYNIWTDKLVNAYYTSAVTSMLQNFHNFFYASFDPGGYVTVDKPPVAFWLQTISAYLFGLHGWSVILPQALAGVGSTLLVYALVKPSFGLAAARMGSLVMACTPVAAAVARTNNVDSLLVFTLLLGTWMLFKGVRTKKAGWVIAAFAMIGLAFNIKMLQAYMVVPAFYLFYLLAFKVSWKKKGWTLAASTVTLVVVSVAWPVVVDSIPTDQRPYVGSSQTNSVLELAFGYNGVSRLTGNRGTGGGGGAPGMNPSEGRGERSSNRTDQAAQTDNQSSNGSKSTPSNGNQGNGQAGPGRAGQGFPPGNGTGNMPEGFGGKQGPGGGGGMFNTGNPGVLRLFQTELSGQASWMLPFVAFGCIGLFAGLRFRKQLNSGQKEGLFWLGWLIPVMGFFSIAGFFHQYYLVMMGPPIAVLVGAGWSRLWTMFREREGWKGWLLPAAVLCTAAFQVFILSAYTVSIGATWMIAISLIGVAVTLLMIWMRKVERKVFVSAVAGILVLLIAPLFWSATPIIYGQSSQLPAAGPTESRGGTGGGGGRMNGNVNEKLLSYVTEHSTGETYLFATSSATSAAPYIIQTGKPVMAMGGYSGSDPILTVSKIQQLVAEHQVKFFLLGGGMDRGGSSEVTEWIKANATEVPATDWQDTNQTNKGTSDNFRGGMESSGALYEITEQTGGDAK
ncbi:ArnT family glycosyltransferase [Paenibacillus pini]|uniref:Glycosyltransferase n=1 Tax=Paenibacillus pini JCM 16418 TaxID=1236976 RepID=W7YQ28_9BACL|nr:glycosyltransferase family 39 protein [Paenibacillus pini]GAF06671.1 glycosyltransferase [Paenibacillus pini JCM 16418]